MADDNFRLYVAHNGERGDERLVVFINEHGVYGIETNGAPAYAGEYGFEEALMLCNREFKEGDIARLTYEFVANKVYRKEFI